MRAVLCKQFGPPSDLTVENIDSPPVGVGEVKVAVHACGVNFPDTLMVQGLYQVKPPFPFSPGLEVAGEVLEVGAGVIHVGPGDRVAAVAQYGGFAEEVVVPAAMVVTIPDSMEYVTAAGFPLAYGTSHVALDHRAKLRSGETLLVLGAAGGVGLTAVEIGKRMGATVIAAASTAEKLALAQHYGADFAINYTEQSVKELTRQYTGGSGADVIYDPVGGDFTNEALRAIAWEGRYLVIGFAAGAIPQIPANMTILKNCSVVGVYWGAYAERDPRVLIDSLAGLMGWYARGLLKPHVSAIFPLENAADALSMLIDRKAMGKVVLTTGR